VDLLWAVFWAVLSWGSLAAFAVLVILIGPRLDPEGAHASPERMWLWRNQDRLRVSFLGLACIGGLTKSLFPTEVNRNSLAVVYLGWAVGLWLVEKLKGPWFVFDWLCRRVGLPDRRLDEGHAGAEVD
jgi:hypothetical protein